MRSTGAICLGLLLAMAWEAHGGERGGSSLAQEQLNVPNLTSTNKVSSRPARPRTFAAAMEAQARRALDVDKRKLAKGEISLQEFQRNREQASSLGFYDAEFLLAIHRRWKDLIGQYRILEPLGTVRVDFHLHQDGSISDLTCTQSNSELMTGLICQMSVLDLEPFPNWTPGMQAEIGGDQRMVTLTFCHGWGGLHNARYRLEPQRPHLVAKLWEGAGGRQVASTVSVSAPVEIMGVYPGSFWYYSPFGYFPYPYRSSPNMGHQHHGPRPSPVPGMQPPPHGGRRRRSNAQRRGDSLGERLGFL